MSVNLFFFWFFWIFIIARATFGLLSLTHNFFSKSFSLLWIAFTLFGQRPFALLDVLIRRWVFMMLFEHLCEIWLVLALLSVNCQVVIPLLGGNQRFFVAAALVHSRGGVIPAPVSFVVLFIAFCHKRNSLSRLWHGVQSSRQIHLFSNLYSWLRLCSCIF